MKRITKIIIVAALAVCSTFVAKGQSTSTLTFTAACSGSGTADDGANWTVTSDGTESNFDNTKGIHYGTNSAQVQYIQLATSDISGTITKVVVNASTASGVTATVGVTVGGNAFGGNAKSLTTSAANYTFEGNASGEIIVTVTKPSKATKAIYVKSIAVTYTTGGSSLADSNLALTDAPVNLSFDLYNNSSNQTVNYTTSSTGEITVSGGTGYVTTSVNSLTKTITVTPDAVTPSPQTITVSQAADDSYKAGSVTFTVSITDSTPLPTYTVTLADDSTVLTQDEGGAAVTLPARNAIAGYSFAGWSVTNVVPETTTVPTIIPAGSYTPTANITLYPVYTKTEGSGSADTDNVFGHGSFNDNSITWSIASIVSIKQEQNGAQTAPNSSYVSAPRWYSGNRITITPSVTINTISLTANTEAYATTLANSTYTNASATASGTDVTITPSNGANPITIVMGGQSRLSSLIINYVSGTTYYWSSPVAATVETPVIDIAENPFIFSTTATITCTTNGATIKYSYDGENWNDYTTALTITETKTIYAKGVKGNDESSVAVATANKNLANPEIDIDDSGISNTNLFLGTNAGSLSASVKYNNEIIDGATVSWTGSNGEVATISSSGEVTLVSEGSVTFTATYAGNEDYSPKSATYDMTVSNNDPSVSTITFGSASGSTNINNTSVQGNDSNGNTWTVTTAGTSSFTPNQNYAQVGSGNSPASSITFTTTLASEKRIKSFEAKFGGFSGTAGTVTLSVGNVSVETGTLNATTDVTVGGTTDAIGTVLTVTISNISKGVKCYYITFTSESIEPEAPAWSTLPTPSIFVSSEYEIDLSEYVIGYPVPAITLNSTNADSKLYDYEDGLLVFEPTSAGTFEFVFTATNSEGSANATLTISAVSTYITLSSNQIEASAAGKSGTIDVTYQNFTPEDPVVQFYESDGETPATYDWISAEINGDNNLQYLIYTTAGVARSAYLKVVASGVYSELITITQSAPAPLESWVRTALEDLTVGDVFVIVGNNGSNYAMTNDNGTSSAPAATAVTVSRDEITSEVANNIKWNLTVSSDGYTFCPNGTTGTWLYCTNTNNGLRVGTGNAQHFTMDSDGYLTTTETGTQRYLGIYNAQDWRCYDNKTGNIAGQTFAFYKQSVVTPEDPTITLSAAENNGRYWATFYSGSSRYTLPEGAQAFTMNTEKELYQLGTDGSIIPAETAVIIISNSAHITLTKSESTTPIKIHDGDDTDGEDTNILLGSNYPVATSIVDGTPYVLGIKEGTLGLYQLSLEEIPAMKAYILVK